MRCCIHRQTLCSSHRGQYSVFPLRGHNLDVHKWGMKCPGSIVVVYMKRPNEMKRLNDILTLHFSEEMHS